MKYLHDGSNQPSISLQTRDTHIRLVLKTWYVLDSSHTTGRRQF